MKSIPTSDLSRARGFRDGGRCRRASTAVVRRLGDAILCLALAASPLCHGEEGRGEMQRPTAGPDAQAFNPMHDRYWLGGFKESFTSEIPEELKHVDALTRARKLGRLVSIQNRNVPFCPRYRCPLWR
jgi:hypothetical protein